MRASDVPAFPLIFTNAIKKDDNAKIAPPNVAINNSVKVYSNPLKWRYTKYQTKPISTISPLKLKTAEILTSSASPK